MGEARMEIRCRCGASISVDKGDSCGWPDAVKTFMSNHKECLQGPDSARLTALLEKAEGIIDDLWHKALGNDCVDSGDPEMQQARQILAEIREGK